MTLKWRLLGIDAFDGTEYYISTAPYKREYDTYAEAREAARERLRELERYQPSPRSGGQAGLQDSVLVLHPDGSRERIVSP